MDRFVWTIYSDDVRFEIGNKISYIGVYFGNLFVPSFPYSLPKLCVTIAVRTLASHPFEKMVLKLLKDDAPLLEVPVDLGAPSSGPPLIGAEAEALNNQYTTYQSTLQLFPFTVEGPFRLRVRVLADGEELRGAALQISKSPEVSAQSHVQTDTK